MATVDVCYDSLDGLSVGDALGAQFFVPGTHIKDLVDGRLPSGPWPWTDDTEMACSIVGELVDYGCLDQDRLAAVFADRFEPYRGYGGGAVVVLRQIREGAAWREASRSAFRGQGSMGNGAAMRVAPLGAFYSGDCRVAALEAIRSAEVTHAHPEAILAAVAVAVAAAEAGNARLTAHQLKPSEFLDGVLDYLVDSRVKTGVERARRLLGVSVAEAAYELGNGAQVLAYDTVPFALWVAATHCDNYSSAILACIEAGGDIDTTAAIVGGIVAAYTGTYTGKDKDKDKGKGTGPVNGIPVEWLGRREALPLFARCRVTSSSPIEV